MPQERKRIDVRSFPLSFGIAHNGNGEEQEIVSGAGVLRITNVRYRCALSHKLAFAQPIRISIEMSIVVKIFLIQAQLINGCPASITLEQFDNCPIGGRDYGRAMRRRYINRVMNSSFGTSCGKRVDQLLRSDAGN